MRPCVFSVDTKITCIFSVVDHRPRRSCASSQRSSSADQPKRNGGSWIHEKIAKLHELFLQHTVFASWCRDASTSISKPASVHLFACAFWRIAGKERKGAEGPLCSASRTHCTSTNRFLLEGARCTTHLMYTHLCAFCIFTFFAFS
jgi:hypothetical protein